MQDLICEYRKSLRLLRSAKVVPMECSRMVSDTMYAIEIMETGKIPGTRWTVARWARNKREIPVDPHVMARYFSTKRTTVEPLPEEGIKLLKELLSALTPKEREAYYLVRGELFSFSKAAYIMGCKKGALQSYVKRAERKIQFALRKQTISEGVCLS